MPSKNMSELTAEDKRDILVERLRRKAREDRIAPLSLHQQRLWFIDQLEPGNALYNLGNAVRISGKIDFGIIQRVLNEIVKRHESLRTIFRFEDGNPVQVILPPFSVPVKVIDLTRGDPGSEEEVKRVAKKETCRPFDLGKGPLIRIVLMRLADDEHVAIMVMHHIICDGWSIGVFLRELGMLYKAFSESKPSPLPRLPIQYRDYARWQHKYIKGEVLNKLISFWKTTLGDAPHGLQLPTDKARSTLLPREHLKESFSLKNHVTDSLKQLSVKEGVTLFMTLLAALDVLLARNTTQDDILVGSPVAERDRPETQGLIGFLVNTVVFRTDLSGNPSFRELLKRVQQTALGAYAHQHLPFDKLVEIVRPARNLGLDPLVQVMFALQNMPLPEFGYPGHTISLLDYNLWIPPVDLAVECFEEPGGTRITFSYNGDVFENSSIERLARQLHSILRSVCSNPDQHIGKIPLLTDAEKRQIVYEWNNTQIELVEEVCIHNLFEIQADKTPDAVALVSDHGQLTYRELDERANQLAHYLQSRGVAKEVIVAICMERSLDRIVAILAILKAGGAYLPVDPTYPRERLMYMLSDSGANRVLTHSHLSSALRPANAEIICFDTGWPHISNAPTTPPKTDVSPDNLAYVIYTSGSTGMPKGVLIEHRSVVNLAVSFINIYSTTPLDRVLQLAPISFDVAVGEMFPILCSGGSVVVPEHATHLDVESLLTTIGKHHVTIIASVPSLLAALNERAKEIPSVRVIMSGGDPLSYEAISELLSVTNISNCYGPTETTVCSLFHKIDKNECSPYSKIPIGRPILNTKAFILDSLLNPVPVNVSGELYIGGPGLARGYFNKPEQTAESFILNPFGDRGDRLYRTGDLARYRSDGRIEFLGRRDQQIKVRGLRIELGEIESRLSQHPQIADCAAIAVGNHQTDKQLVAYYVNHANAAISGSRLRQHLSASLPSYMVPLRFVLVESVPRTPSGKVDRQKLAALDTRRREVDQEYVPPRSDDQSVLAAIWKDVLGVDRVGINDDYFALGGHSLLAVQLMSRVKEAFQLDIPLRTLFDAPTVALLAEKIESIRDGKVNSATWQKQEMTPLVPIKTSGNGAPVYCIHHIGGHIFSYKHLAALLSPRFRVYGIQSRALTDPTTEHDSLEYMASDYADVIRSQQPDGPYNLIGYSSGGLVAIAIAHKLERMGASVGFVGLIDTRFPGNDQQAIDRDSLHHLLHFLRYSFADTIEILGDTMDAALNQADTLYEKLLSLSNDERIDYICRWLDNLNLPHDGLSDLLKQQLTLYHHHCSMLKSFRPSLIHSPLLVLWAKEEIPGTQHQPHVDWTNYTSNEVFAETTEGNHFTIMRPAAVRTLAVHLIAHAERVSSAAFV